MCKIDYVKQQEIIEELSELIQLSETNENLALCVAKTKGYVYSNPILKRYYDDKLNKFAECQKNKKIKKSIIEYFDYINTFAQTSKLYNAGLMDDIAIDLYYPECMRYVYTFIPDRSKEMLNPKLQEGVLHYYFAILSYYDAANFFQRENQELYRKGWGIYWKLRYELNLDTLTDYFILEKRIQDINNPQKLSAVKENIYRVALLTVIKDLREFINYAEIVNIPIDLPIEDKNKLAELTIIENSNSNQKNKKVIKQKLRVKYSNNYENIKNDKKVYIYIAQQKCAFTQAQYSLVWDLIKNRPVKTTGANRVHKKAINDIVKNSLNIDEDFIVLMETKREYEINYKLFNID